MSTTTPLNPLGQSPSPYVEAAVLYERVGAGNPTIEVKTSGLYEISLIGSGGGSLSVSLRSSYYSKGRKKHKSAYHSCAGGYGSFLYAKVILEKGLYRLFSSNAGTNTHRGYGEIGHFYIEVPATAGGASFIQGTAQPNTDVLYSAGGSSFCTATGSSHGKTCWVVCSTGADGSSRYAIGTSYIKPGTLVYGSCRSLTPDLRATLTGDPASLYGNPSQPGYIRLKYLNRR